MQAPPFTVQGIEVVVEEVVEVVLVLEVEVLVLEVVVVDTQPEVVQRELHSGFVVPQL